MITKQVHKCSTCYTFYLIIMLAWKKYMEIKQKHTIKTKVHYTHHNFTFSVPFFCLHARIFMTFRFKKKIKTFRCFVKP